MKFIGWELRGCKLFEKKTKKWLDFLPAKIRNYPAPFVCPSLTQKYFFVKVNLARGGSISCNRVKGKTKVWGTPLVDDERSRASCAAVVRGKWVIVRILEAMNRESDSDLSFYMQSYIYWEISSLKIKLKMVENEENVKWKLRDGSHEKEGVRSWHHRGKWWFYVGINEFKLKGGMWSMDVGLWTEK